jgi:hypothetical protein
MTFSRFLIKNCFYVHFSYDITLLRKLRFVACDISWFSIILKDYTSHIIYAQVENLSYLTSQVFVLRG